MAKISKEIKKKEKKLEKCTNDNASSKNFGQHKWYH